MGSSTGHGGDEVSERPLSSSGRPFPITEIRTHPPPPKQNFGFLKILSYGLPWVAWLINVALLITPQYQKVDISLCIGEDVQKQLIDTGITNVSSLSALCEYRVYYLGVAQCTEELTSSSTLSVSEEVGDLAFNDFALAAAIVPVALGFILMCLCCGPVLLGEFAQGQSMLWNISTLVDFICALFSGLTILFLETNICDEQQICTVLQDSDRYSTIASSMLGFSGSVSAVNNNNGNNNGDDGNNPIAMDCEQRCSVDAGFYLSIVATSLWLLAFVGTVMLKKANAKIHP